MRYFVTGATGFLGGRLVPMLRQSGHEVIALVRDPSRAGQLDAELVRGDVTDRESMRAGMAGADGVFHLAAWYKVGAKDAREAERINVEGTRNVLELVRDLGVPKVVYTSSLAVNSDTGGRVVDESYRYDGPHLSEYDRTKWLAHYEVAEPLARAGVPVVTVQPGVVYGPGDQSPMRSFWQLYLRRRLPLAPRGTAFNWGHVEDTARGHLLAMEKGRTGESYIIAGPPHTLHEALRIAERVTGIPAPPAAPALLFKAMAALASPFAGLMPDGYHPEGLRVMAGSTYLGSSAKAERELGFTARPLEEGLPETLEALRSAG